MPDTPPSSGADASVDAAPSTGDAPDAAASRLPQPGDAYEVPAAGSLGLLALGARGLDAWRAKRDAVRRARAEAADATAAADDAPDDANDA
jgi:hypothetical protein